MERVITKIMDEMSELLNAEQQQKLLQVLVANLAENKSSVSPASNREYLKMFLDAKRIEGCSRSTLAYYRSSLDRFFTTVTDPVRQITTGQIRTYLADYQQGSNCSNVTLDNLRRNLSSFFFLDGRRESYSKEPYGPHPQNSHERTGQGGHIRRNDRTPSGQL